MTGTQCRDKCIVRGEGRKSVKKKRDNIESEKALRLEDQEDKG